MHIVHLPIEPLEQRYSYDWLHWYRIHIPELNVPDLTQRYMLGDAYDRIEDGAFLDVTGTCLYKTDQMCSVIKYIQVKKQDPDFDWSKQIFFFHDLWHPGVLELLYIRDGLGLPFKITGMLHAGTYDPHDFLTKSGMDTWAQHLELAMWSEVHQIYVATEFHKRLILNSRDLNPDRIHVTGFPIYPRKRTSSNIYKRNAVVFPHRLDEEKNPDLFYQLEREIVTNYGRSDIRCETIFNKGLSKEEYYRRLEDYKVAVSFAKQETWGIAMQESVFAGCIPMVPNHLSYEEMYHPDFKFGQFEDIKDVAIRVIDMVDHYNDHQKTLEEQYNKLAVAGKQAIGNQIHLMEELVK